MRELDAAPMMQPRVEAADLAPYGIDVPHPFVVDLQIDAAELSGTIEHVSNIAYVRWVDRAAELHGDVHGQSRAALLARNRMWFVARHEIDYLGEVFANDTMLAATWVSRIGRTTCFRETVIARPADETVVCRGHTRWALVDLSSRRPARIDDDLRSEILAMNGRVPHPERRS